MVAMCVVPRDAVEDALVLGELALDGAIQLVSGVLPAAIAAVAAGRDLICPHDCGSEAAWAEGLSIIVPPSLVDHIHGRQVFASANAKNGTRSAKYARSC